MWTAFVAMRLRVTYELKNEFAKLHVEHQEQVATNARQLEDVRLRLDYLEQVLFGEVLAKLDKKQPRVQPMRLEPWLANTIKDLRDRVTVLERARVEKNDDKPEER